MTTVSYEMAPARRARVCRHSRKTSRVLKETITIETAGLTPLVRLDTARLKLQFPG